MSPVPAPSFRFQVDIRLLQVCLAVDGALTLAAQYPQLEVKLFLKLGHVPGRGSSHRGVTYPSKDHCSASFLKLACVYIFQCNFTSMHKCDDTHHFTPAQLFSFPPLACPPTTLLPLLLASTPGSSKSCFSVLSCDHRACSSSHRERSGHIPQASSVVPEPPPPIFCVSLLF